jgi:hypothetical protein
MRALAGRRRNCRPRHGKTAQIVKESGKGDLRPTAIESGTLKRT